MNFWHAQIRCSGDPQQTQFGLYLGGPFPVAPGWGTAGIGFDLGISVDPPGEGAPVA